jgi:hypothetical protein
MGVQMTNNTRKPSFPVFTPDLQISFYRRLRIFNTSHLGEALRSTIEQLDIAKVDEELNRYVKHSSLRKLASFGLRGEVLFPVPYVIHERPSLLGYYRLLYGISQKEFYRGSGFTSFKRLEEKNEISERHNPQLNNLCKSLITTATILLDALEEIDLQSVRDLQILTLGAQLRGGQNTKLGKDAAEEVFGLIERIIHNNIVEENPRRLILENAAGRIVNVVFSNDPDIALTEIMESGLRPVLSIEIKGGTDVSNIHNRIGEAEKSHQKAKNSGFLEFWTILGADVDPSIAQRESPTSSRFFYLSRLREIDSSEYRSFRDHIQSITGIKKA